MASRPGPERGEPGEEPATTQAVLDAKRQAGCSLTVCLPAANEAGTIGPIVATIYRELVEAVPLVDDILVVDDASTDDTAAVASAAGARVLAEHSILPVLPTGSGKGNVLWKSLYASGGDIVCWIDADIRDFRAHFVTRLVAPLLDDPAIQLVKGYYRRPLHDAPTGGGRVTELMARPLTSYIFPALADIVQPLSGEYAGRRSALETLPFVMGWGVEFGLLVDVMERFGRASIAQADLGVRAHRNRPLEELGPQALAILVTALRRAGFSTADTELADLVRVRIAGDLELVPVEVRERPPMATVPAYRAKFSGARTV